MDEFMDYNNAVEFVNENGIDAFFNKLKENHSHFELYSLSTAWLKDKQYICKAKGVHGDVVIRWI